jgi:serine phosphatase RsbU (regulator of sigma subunit)
MGRADKQTTSPGKEPRRAELGQVDGLDLHAQYYAARTGGDFFDAVRVGSRVAFLLSDIAGSKRDADPIASAMQDAFRTRAVELFGTGDANLTEGVEMLVQAVNLALIGAASGGICFAPTLLGCYDTQLGVLAYVNAGGQTALVDDSDGARPLPGAGLPLGLTTHMTYQASMQVLEPGAKLLAVTRGVITSRQSKDPFGAQRVQALLSDMKQATAEELCFIVLEAAQTFEKKRWLRLRLGPKPELDDMTALALVRVTS